MEESFDNEQIKIYDLPDIDGLDLQDLHREYLWVSMIGQIIFWLIFGTLGFLASYFWGDRLPFHLGIILPSLLGVIILLSFLATYYGFKRKQYALRQRDIYYKEGLLWRKATIIPFNRIQHVEVVQGPIDRIFGLSVLNVFTAGGSVSDMIIPGLLPFEAQRMKNFIIQKTSFDEEE